jgi:hypothetical protein
MEAATVWDVERVMARLYLLRLRVGRLQRLGAIVPSLRVEGQHNGQREQAEAAEEAQVHAQVAQQHRAVQATAVGVPQLLRVASLAEHVQPRARRPRHRASSAPRHGERRVDGGRERGHAREQHEREQASRRHGEVDADGDGEALVLLRPPDRRHVDAHDAAAVPHGRRRKLRRRSWRRRHSSRRTASLQMNVIPRHRPLLRDQRTTVRNQTTAQQEPGRLGNRSSAPGRVRVGAEPGGRRSVLPAPQCVSQSRQSVSQSVSQCMHV